MKRISVISIVLAIVMVFPFTSYAKKEEENAKSITISEYDMYLDVVNKSTSQLKAEGYTTDEIYLLRNQPFEQMLLERAALPVDILRGYGYNDNQIKLLKEYDGSMISTNSPIMYAISNFTGTVATSGYTATSVTLRYTWQWSSRPLFNYKDAAAIVWNASDSSGYKILTDIISSECYVAYRNTTTGNLAMNKNVGTTKNVVNEYLYSNFEMTEILSGDNNWGWAKSGRLDVKIKPRGSVNFSSVSAVAGYGHAKLTGSIGVSASSSGLPLSFTPANRVDTETVSKTFYR